MRDNKPHIPPYNIPMSVGLLLRSASFIFPNYLPCFPLHFSTMFHPLYLAKSLI